MDGLTVLAQGEAAVSGDPVAKEQSLKCVLRRLPPVDSQTPALLQTRAYGGRWGVNRFPQISPCRRFGGGLSVATGNRWGSVENGTPLVTAALSLLCDAC